MTAVQRDLLQRLLHYDFDGDGGSERFTRRLSRENGWTLAQARRACDEYRRFVFLIQTAGHPCTPSDAVDQVWHLHLLHTRAYWQDFCGKVLEQPLHHEPSRGGVAERAKFNAWYEDTLRSYRATFGETPPADLWPTVSQRCAARHVRIERNACWRIRKPRFLLRAATTFSRRAHWWGVGLISCGIVGCSMRDSASIPFGPNDTSSLLFFAVLWAVSALLAERIRRVGERLSEIPARERDPYEDVLLVGGGTLAANAVLAGAIRSGLLRFDSRRKRCSRNPLASLTTAPSLQRVAVQLCDALGGDLRLGRLRAALATRCEAALTPRLEQRGLVWSRQQLRQSLLVALTAPVLGAIEVGRGIANDEEVLLLIIACGMAVRFAWKRHFRKRQPTSAGKRVREHLMSEMRAPRDPVAAQALDPVALAVGVFGTQVLAGTALATGSIDSAGGTGSSADDSGGGGCSTGGCGGCGGCGG